jgi:SAM-dependent methyltransferase
MERSYLDIIREFALEHREMDPNASNRHMGPRHGQLLTYLDMALIKDWTAHHLPLSKHGSLRVLDVGAGKGRTARHLMHMSSSLVAIEPAPDFFAVLQSTCSGDNLECRQCTLSEYVKETPSPFDLVYSSGVTWFLDNEETMQFFSELERVLEKSSILILRDYGLEERYGTENAYGISRPEGYLGVLRPPSGIIALARRLGFHCLAYRRSYPINIPLAIRTRWPSPATEKLWWVCSHPRTYRLWEFLARLNLPGGKRTNFFTYLFRRG